METQAPQESPRLPENNEDPGAKTSAIEERQALVAERIIALKAVDIVLSEEIEHLQERRKIARLGIADAHKEMQLLNMGQLVMEVD